MQNMVAEMLLNNPSYFGEPVEVSDEQHDRDLAAWRVGRTVRMILSGDCPNGVCIDDPAELRNDLLDLTNDLQDDPHLRKQAVVLMKICTKLIADRGAAK